MKKIIIVLFVILIVLSNIMPVFAVKERVSTAPPPTKPYEKIVAKDGNWHSDRVSYERDTSLLTGYMGDYVNNSSNEGMGFEIKEETVLSNISLPFISEPLEPVTIRLQDDKGNIYDNLRTQKVTTETLSKGIGAENDASAEEKISYVYNSDGNIVLPKGQYTMTVGGSEDSVGAFMVKGTNSAGYEKYKEDLVKWESENNSNLLEGTEVFKTVGNEEFHEQDLDKYKNIELETPQIKNPMAFFLDSEYMIDEIIINTYNDGNGSEPGIITIFNESGEVELSEQAYGGSLGDTANGIWKISPRIVLASGNYFINIDNPEILSYDVSGEPLFYVNASIPVSIRYDFTGTYSINLDSYKTRTLMGLVNSPDSSFSLKDFELTVIDREGQIELIGKYENIPFSQGCEIVEENENSIVAKFDFAADLTKLPYKAKIGADAMVTLLKPENGNATISVEGVGNFKREATSEKGADDNDYSIVSNGAMKHKELPIFVMTALGKSSDAGNIPGPDNATQAATGLLFPPLVGLVVASLQDALKPKAKAKKKAKDKTKANEEKPEVRDKNWYKKKYPGKTDEQIAMIMLGDAMGGTDNPDEGDAVSVGDNEKPGGSDYEGNDGYEEEDYDNNEESEDETSYEEEPEQQLETKPEPEPEPEQPKKEEIPEEPEEMILQTSANGAMERYVKDPATGEWVNAESGNTLNYEKYKEDAEKQFAENKKINDAEFEKLSKGETEQDKIVRDEMKKIREEEAKVEHQNKMKSKYGTDDLDEIDRIIEKKAVLEKKSFETWQKIGDFNKVGEVGATVVLATADTAIDGLSTVVPGGNYVKAGYKVTKGIAGTMAEKGVSKASLYEGSIKGGVDAALDAKYFGNNPLKKAGVTILGEAVGSAVGDANRNGGDWAKAAKEGAIDGTFKVIVGAASDKLAGDSNIVLPKGAPKFLPTMKNVLVNKNSGVKIGGALTDEFVIKPKVVNPIKKSVVGK